MKDCILLSEQKVVRWKKKGKIIRRGNNKKKVKRGEPT